MRKDVSHLPYTVLIVIVIVNSRFLHRPQKCSCENQLIHRRLTRTKSIGSGSRSRESCTLPCPIQSRSSINYSISVFKIVTFSTASHILSKIYNCTKHGNQPTNSAEPARFTLHVSILQLHK